MGKIRILPDDVASRVAAGEVVERPASVVKELAENSLDAGAQKIIIESIRGGTRLLSVRDDGCGMSRDDALLSLERHATSKLRTAADLATVRTMGFRGEALPSIASVSRFRLITRPPEVATGTEIECTGGRIVGVRESGCPSGTLVEVRDLFFNVPARLKFLRGEETESAQIVQTIQALAISAPHVALEFRRDGRELLKLPSTPTLEMRLRDLFGPDFMLRLIELPPTSYPGLSLSGFIGKPGQGRRDRLGQQIILNSRPIVSPEISGALREAFTGCLPPGLQPLAILHLELDMAAVDCNVHPAKKQVRFARPEEIRRAIFETTQAALSSLKNQIRLPAAPPIPIPQHQQEFPSTTTPSPFPLPHRQGQLLPNHHQTGQNANPSLTPTPANSPQTQNGIPMDTQCPIPPTHETHPPHPVPSSSLGGYHILGRLGDSFFAIEGPEGLVLMDTRNARQRVAFEELIRQIETGQAPSQRLLIPEIIELPAREHTWIVEHLDDLHQAGFQIENFGGMSIKVDAIPAAVSSQPVAAILHEIATSLREAGKLPPGHGIRQILARAVSRFSSQPRPLDTSEAAALLEALLRCDLPYAAPLGQPTLIQFSFAELERRFGR